MSRVPMIQFRHGVRVIVAAVAPVAASVYDLPAKFQPLPWSEEELDSVRVGGTFDLPAKKKK